MISEKIKRKNVKKTVRYMSWGLVIYSILSVVSVLGMLIAYMLAMVVKMYFFDKRTASEIDLFLDGMLENENLLGGFTCVAVILGTLFLVIYFCKRVNLKQMFVTVQKMNAPFFGKALCVFMGMQIVSEVLYRGMEAAFNLFGYSVAASMEEACYNETTPFMILYAAIVGPVVEEVIYRGFVMHSLKKHGKLFAIIVSSVLFGVMHGNLPQSVFAFLTGLVLAYVAMEYSIWWSIALHIINNGGFGTVLSELTANLSVQQQDMICWAIMIVFFLLGVFFLIRGRKQLREYMVNNKIEKKNMLYAFTTVGMVVFIVMEMLMAISAIERL